MTTPEIFMWAATALNIGGVCYSAWFVKRHNRLHGNLVDMSKELIEALENELQKRVELTMDLAQLHSDKKELREAAEFEARVAAKLVTVPLLGCNSNCPWNKMDPKNSFGCIHEYERRFCRLRNARLAVEEEMDR